MSLMCRSRAHLPGFICQFRWGTMCAPIYVVNELVSGGSVTGTSYVGWVGVGVVLWYSLALIFHCLANNPCQSPHWWGIR